jgi:hypothetical protein
MPKGFILVKCTGSDDATITRVGGLFVNVGEAGRAAGRDLMASHGVPQTQAEEFAALLAKEWDAPGTVALDTIVYNPASNQNYRILTADFTSNGVPITPGLRVQENNKRLGTVDAAQFMNGGMLVPGGECFDHWYYVLRDDESRAVERFNGERMRAL